MTGTVKFFNQEKGFGFIIPDGGGKDVFVHATAVKGITLNEGDTVSFKVVDGKKGEMAADIKLT